MKQFCIFIFTVGVILFSNFAYTEEVKNSAVVESINSDLSEQYLKTPVGKWKSIDDETGKPKSIIEITQSKDAKLIGKIIHLFREPSEDQNPKCDKCTGDKKDQPILNMQIMHGFKKKSDIKWVDGEILDPKKGKVYSCKLTLIDGGKKLEVRGFIGFSLLGRTQTWIRE
jgi:uncharacterized protein (DUF2147 family)